MLGSGIVNQSVMGLLEMGLFPSSLNFHGPRHQPFIPPSWTSPHPLAFASCALPCNLQVCHLPVRFGR